MDEPTRSIQTKDLNIPANRDDFLKRVSHLNWTRSESVFKFEVPWLAPEVVPCQNGFIWAAAKMHDSDHSVSIRIHNMWLAILAQLRPLIYRNCRFPQNMAIITFTNQELDDPTVVATRLSDAVNTKLCVDLAETLMPNFEDTKPEDTASAALLLLGKYCTARQHRELGPKKLSISRGARFLGGEADWDKLKEKLATLRHMRIELEAPVNRLSEFLSRLLQVGALDNSGHPYVGSDKRDPKA
ncbi:hypothetical protein FPANT_5880 [Fusarium pseudoanthophilum]|uniref:Uncharacterized protein n=1 Tax=Fusarium pseudoanthophilum TaxID=48495 RepID=A0A8H5LDB5_9HYPO|nr:hypothetical protein FPANT_5880 [Fusarium pseudoanthophilum]